MPNDPPINESIKFLETGVVDVFPTVYNYGTSNVPEKYTKAWAEYYNKIRNFIGIVQPLCITETAQNLGVSSLTYWTLNPAPTISEIIYGSAKRAYLLGKAPPTNVFPFEIVITSSSDNYSSWSRLSPSSPTPRMLYQAPLATINKIAFGNLYTLKPMVSCCIKSTNETYLSTNWVVNAYVMTGTDSLVIRGSIIDPTDYNTVGTYSTELPPLSVSYPNSNFHRLHVTLIGIRT